MGAINVRVVYEDESQIIDIEFDRAVFNFMCSLGFREVIKMENEVTKNRALHYTRVLKDKEKI